MIEWFVYVQVVVASVGALIAIIAGLAGRAPGDVTLGFLALSWVLLLAQTVISIVAPFTGNHPTGSLVEFWVYLISALLVPPAAAMWALLERSRWSTVIVGIAGLTVAIMVYRMWQIWAVQLA